MVNETNENRRKDGLVKFGRLSKVAEKTNGEGIGERLFVICKSILGHLMGTGDSELGEGCGSESGQHWAISSGCYNLMDCALSLH